MIPKKFRLKNKKAFDATYKQRHSVSDKYLILYAGRTKSNLELPIKIGFVVSKKYHKRAVKRNRVKRLIRESCRLLLKEGAIPEKYLSLIFMPRNSSLEADFKQIKRSVEALLKKI